MDLNLFLFALIGAFFGGYQLGRRKRMDRLETKIEALEVRAGIRREG